MIWKGDICIYIYIYIYIYITILRGLFSHICVAYMCIVHKYSQKFKGIKIKGNEQISHKNIQMTQKWKVMKTKLCITHNRRKQIELH